MSLWSRTTVFDPPKCLCCPGVEHGQHDLYTDAAQASGQRDGSGRLQGPPLLRSRGQHRQGSARLHAPHPFTSSFTTRTSPLSGLVVKGPCLSVSFSSGVDVLRRHSAPLGLRQQETCYNYGNLSKFFFFLEEKLIYLTHLHPTVTA